MTTTIRALFLNRREAAAIHEAHKLERELASHISRERRAIARQYRAARRAHLLAVLAKRNPETPGYSATWPKVLTVPRGIFALTQPR